MKSLIHRISTHVAFIPVLSLLLSGLLFTKLAFFAYFGLIALLALYIPLKTTNYVLRLILSYLLLYSITAIVGALLWIAKVDDALSLALPITAAVIGLAVIPFNQRMVRPTVDIPGIVVSVGIIILAFMPYLQHKNFASLFQTFAYQGDNISHIDMLNANARYHHYIYYKKADLGAYIAKTLSGYPQAWHFNMATVQDYTDRLMNINDIPFRQLLIFQMFGAMHFAMLVYLSYETIRLLSRRLLGQTESKRQKFLSQLVAVATIAGLFLGTFATLYSFGFQTHIAALLLSLAVFFYLVLQPQRDGNKPLDRRPFIFAALCFAGLTMTWQVIAVPAGLALAAIMFYKKIIILNKQLWRDYKFIALMLFIVAAAAFQFYILVHFGNEATSIMEPGYTPEPRSSLLLLITGLLLIAGVFYKDKVYKDSGFFTLLTLWVPSAAYCLVLYLVLEARIGGQLYYYFKSTFSLILFGVLFIAPVVVLLLVKVSTNLPRRSFIVLSCGLMFAGASAVALNLSKESIALYNGNLATIDLQVADAMNTHFNQPAPERAKVYFVGSCIPDQDYKANRFAQALAANPAIKHIRLSTPFDKFKTPYLNAIGAQAQVDPNRTLYVIASDKAIYDEVKREFSYNPKVVPVTLDPQGLNKKDKALCPNFVGFTSR